MIYLIAIILPLLIYLVARAHYSTKHRGNLEEVNKHIEQILTEFKKKPIKDLRALESKPQEETHSFGDLQFKITAWARKHDKEDKLGVIVEYRKVHQLGFSTVGAAGFFTDPTGVKDMREEDLWDYGY